MSSFNVTYAVFKEDMTVYFVKHINIPEENATDRYWNRVRKFQKNNQHLKIIGKYADSVFSIENDGEAYSYRDVHYDIKINKFNQDVITYTHKDCTYVTGITDLNTKTIDFKDFK